MSAIDRILLLISLLNNRRYVTLETIKQTCDIPERTIYRYLNTLSEANIPVYYDKNLRAYRLNTEHAASVDSLQINEALILVIALKVLGARVNGDYKQDIDALVQKIMVAQPFPVEDIIRSFKHQMETIPESGDFSSLVSSVLINGAIVCDRKVRVTTKSRGPKQEDIDIDRPSLRFQKSWHLVGQHNARTTKTSVADIKRVAIL